jgi:hypothetical protein
MCLSGTDYGGHDDDSQKRLPGSQVNSGIRAVVGVNGVHTGAVMDTEGPEHVSTPSKGQFAK